MAPARHNGRPDRGRRRVRWALVLAVVPAETCRVSPTEAFGKSVSYWQWLWADYGCPGLFEVQTVAAEVQAATNNGCEVTLRRPSGNLRTVLGSDSNVVSASIAPPATAPGRRSSHGWAPPSFELCHMGSMAGIAPVPPLFEPGRFAAASLTAQRSFLQCGPKVPPPPNGSAPWRASQIVGAAVEEHVSIQTSEGVTAVRLLRMEVWDNITMRASITHRFLQSDPEPCDSSTGGEITPAVPYPRQAPAIAPPTSNVQGTALMGVEESWWDRKAEWMVDLAVTQFEEHLPFLPATYDFRRRVPMCVLPIRISGVCGSAWASASLGTIEKQRCMLSKGTRKERLSVQTALMCCRDSMGCYGGRPEDVFEMALEEGIPLESCGPDGSQPTSQDSADELDRRSPVSSFFPPKNGTTHPLGGPRQGEQTEGMDVCWNKKGQKCQRVQGRSPTVEEELYAEINGLMIPGVSYLIGERMIQAAIIVYGAVVTKVRVYSDFLGYTGGVYRKLKQISYTELLGSHHVQLIGWGDDRASGTPYWIGENSWGADWGEDGYFRWMRGTDHLGIERLALHGFAADFFPPHLDTTSLVEGLRIQKRLADGMLAHEKRQKHFYQTCAYLAGAAAFAATIVAFLACGLLLRRRISESNAGSLFASERSMYSPVSTERYK